MTTDIFQEIFTDSVLNELFPSGRANDFFEALYGDIEEGSYDISLAYQGLSSDQKSLQFLLNLSERPGKCLACHLTHGLPEVFSRHPIINVRGIVGKIDEQLGDKASCGEWHLDSTKTISRQLYAVPLIIKLT
ncbi:MAG: pancreas/duodenum homeobox protein 1 [Thermodesulfobacteriota bacterium]